VTLVSFSFLASSPGSAVFGVSSDLDDPNEGVFLLSGATLDLTGQTTISVLSQTPEPGTLPLSLLAAGLVLAFRRHKRQNRAPGRW
jgi:hypothetical protein